MAEKEIKQEEKRQKLEKEKEKKRKDVQVPKHIKLNNEKSQLSAQNNQKIEEYFDDPKIQAFFLKHQKEFQTIFKIYVNKEYTPLNIQGER